VLTRRANATLEDQLSRFPCSVRRSRRGATGCERSRCSPTASGAAAAAALGLSTYFFFSTQTPSDEPRTNDVLRAQISPRLSTVTWQGAV
jgi:hypothetical protein